MNALITGGGGLLATALAEVGGRRGWRIRSRPHDSLDVTSGEQVEATLRAEATDIVLHCAAYTNVDAAESDEAEATRVNRDGAGVVAEVCATLGVTILYPSTDYVFRGDVNRPYRTTDEPDPVNAYGRSKLAGERAVARTGARHLIVRTSWLYGAGGRDFVDTMLEIGGSRGAVSVVDDQTGRPTWTEDLASALLELAERRATGTLHVAGGGEATWKDLADEVFRIADLSVEVEATTTRAFGAAAPRPPYSVLDTSDAMAILGRGLPDWRESLARYLRGHREPRRAVRAS